MFVWGRAPMRFFVLGSVGGILVEYGLFRLLLGLPEMTSMGLGMVLLWPVAALGEVRWRRGHGHSLTDREVASIWGVPTWIAGAVLVVLWMVLALLGERV